MHNIFYWWTVEEHTYWYDTDTVQCGLFESGYFSSAYDVFMPYTLTLTKLVKVASDGDSYRGGRGIDL